MAITKVTTDVITALAVTAPKLAANAVTTDKLADNAVTAAKIAAGALGDQVAGITSSASATTIAGTLTSTGAITGTLATAAQTNITSLGTLTALTVDDITINGSTISDGADLTLDVAGYIALNADNAGTVIFEDASLQYLVVENSSSDAVFRAGVQNKDILFKGNDNGSTITALTLDMSDAGSAYFNNKVAIGHTSAVSSSTLTLNGNQSALALSRNTGTDVTWTLSSDAENMYLSDDGNVTYNMMWKNNGNIGMGTTSPTSALHVAADTAIITLEDTNGSGNAATPYVLFEDSGNTDLGYVGYGSGSNSNLIIANLANADMQFLTNSETRMYINSTGKVGIGDNDPFSKLHVEDTSWSSGSPYGTVLSVTGNNVNDNNWGHLIVTDSSTGNGNGGSIRFGTGTADSSNLNPFAGIQGVAEGTSYGGLGLYTRPSGGTGTERMRIDSAGKIGIGIDAPTHKLHAVSGDAKGFFLNRTSGSNPANLAEYSTHYSLSILNRDSGSYLNFGGTANYSSMQATDGAGSPAAKIISLNPHGGNVGIGETVPIRRLVVNHPGGSSPHNGILLHADVDTAGGSNGLYFKNDSTNDDRRMKGAIIFERDDPGTRGTGKLHLCVEGVNSDTNVAVNHSRLAIHADGNIHTKSLFVDTTTDNSVSNDDGIVLSDAAYQVIRRGATMLYLHHTGGSGTGTLVAINKAQATVGTITATNSNAAYNTSSDYRLKENVDYTWDATTRLKQLKPARFNWVIDSTNTLQDGFMAHEVQSIVPEAVTGTKDAVWSAEEEENGEGTEGAIKGQQMDHSKLVPLLVKTVQELEARIKVLEG